MRENSITAAVDYIPVQENIKPQQVVRHDYEDKYVMIILLQYTINRNNNRFRQYMNSLFHIPFGTKVCC